MTAYLGGALVPRQVMDVWNGWGSKDKKDHSTTQRAWTDLTFACVTGGLWYLAGDMISPFLSTKVGIATVIGIITSVGKAVWSVQKTELHVLIPSFEGTARLVAGAAVVMTGASGIRASGTAEIAKNLGMIVGGLMLTADLPQQIVSAAYGKISNFMPTCAHKTL